MTVAATAFAVDVAGWVTVTVTTCFVGEAVAPDACEVGVTVTSTTCGVAVTVPLVCTVAVVEAPICGVVRAPEVGDTVVSDETVASGAEVP